MKVKEESEKAGLKLSIQKIKIMASGPITLWQIEGENAFGSHFETKSKYLKLYTPAENTGILLQC